MNKSFFKVVFKFLLIFCFLILILLKNATSFISYYWEKNTDLCYQNDYINVYASRLYTKESLDGLVYTIDKTIRKSKDIGIKVEKDISLFFFFDKEDLKRNHADFLNGNFVGYTIGLSCIFSSFNFEEENLESNIQIIVHELTHVYESELLGINCTEKWKIEGLAEFYSGHSTLDLNEGEKCFLYRSCSEKDFSYLYFLGRLRTDYLLRHKGIPEDEYWDTNYDTDKLDDEIREALQSGEYRAFEQ